MHQFFHTHNFAIFIAAGRKAMIEELKDLQNKLDVAGAMLYAISELLDRLAGRGGVSEVMARQLAGRGKRVKI